MKKFSILILIQLLVSIIDMTQAQWVKTNGPYFWDETVLSIAVDNNNVFAGTYSRLYKSIDGGLNWTQINSDGFGTYRSIVIDGNNIFCGTDVGVYRSTDAGVNWLLVNSGLPQYPQIYTIAIAGNNIFAGGSMGVYLSTNNGSNWSSVNNGLPNKWVKTIVIKGNDIFIGSTGGVYYTSNNGTNWSVRNSGLTDSSIVELCIKGNDLFAGTWNGGIYYSSNDGLNWTYKGLTGAYFHGIGVCENNIITSTTSGLYISTDNGSTWSSINNGLMNLTVFSLAINGDSIFIGNAEGVHFALKNNYYWSPLNKGFHADITSIGSMGSDLFAGTYRNGLWRSNDNGLNWNQINPQSPIRNIWNMVINGTNIFVAAGGLVYLSSDSGSNWNNVSNGLPGISCSIESMASIFSSVFVGTEDMGIYQTTNNGLNWYDRNIGIEYPYPSINSIAFDGYRIFLGTSSGVYLSDNYGTTWSLMNAGLTNTNIQSVAFMGENIVAGTLGGGVHLSTDHGSTWLTVNNGLSGMWVNSLTVCNNIIIALVSVDEINISTDGGSSWRLVSDNLVGRFVANLWSINGIIFATEFLNGLWRRPLSELTDVNLNEMPPIHFQLNQNYPNPFNPATTITYQIPQREFVTLKVYDILGREVATLVNEEKPASSYEVEFNPASSIKNPASGIYFYKLSAGSYTETKKMILLR